MKVDTLCIPQPCGKCACVCGMDYASTRCLDLPCSHRRMVLLLLLWQRKDQFAASQVPKKQVEPRLTRKRQMGHFYYYDYFFVSVTLCSGKAWLRGSQASSCVNVPVSHRLLSCLPCCHINCLGLKPPLLYVKPDLSKIREQTWCHLN